MALKKSKLVEIKTKPTVASVTDFINSITDEQKRKDCFTLIEMMNSATGEEPMIWSNAMVGFGKHVYTSPATGRMVEWLKIGFAPRKSNLSLYLTINIKEHNNLLEKLGKHKTGVGCLYINKLDDIDLKVLEKLIQLSSVKK